MKPDLRLPSPPESLRRGPFRDGTFTSPLHHPRTAVAVGRALGVAFVVCFVTGLISHVLQHPPTWLNPPSRPAWGYRLTQGLHIASGIAAVPLLLAKLWTVYPKLFEWPPVRSVVHAMERLSIAVLVAGALFELFTGLLNTVQWYPWPFDFVQTHFWVAWVTVGALLLHLAIKAPVIAANWWRRREQRSEARLSRRGFLTAVGAATGVATITTVGQSFTPLKSVDLLAPRHPDHGPQHLPVNRTAAAAGVVRAAASPEWRLSVHGPRPYQLALDELRSLPQYEVRLPIACVEGWSVDAQWTGVRIRDLLERAGAPAHARVRFISLETSGAYGVMEMGRSYARDPLTLLALRLNGEPLDMDHGYPARVIAPNRPGVLQTKWVSRLEVLS